MNYKKDMNFSKWTGLKILPSKFRNVFEGFSNINEQKVDNRKLLWTLFTLENWYEKHLNSRI